MSVFDKEMSNMNAFFRFIASVTGRLLRSVAGIVLIVVGLVWIHGAGGWILAAIGLVPLAAGVFDRCVFAPLFGLPFVGERLRQAVRNERAVQHEQHA
jgi:type IV secretory pathway VirB2 component (pilin)